jgi:hypothetical protein
MMQCWNYSASVRAESLGITNDVAPEKKASLLADEYNLTDIVYDSNIMRELDDKYLTSTEVIQIIERYFLDTVKNFKNKKYIVQNIYKVYSLLGYDVELPDTIIRRDGKVGRFYKVKFNNYKKDGEQSEQNNTTADSVEVDYDYTNELPF